MVSAERGAGLDNPDVLRGLEERALRSRTALRRYLEDARRDGRVVLGYGAPSKAPILLCSSDADSALLRFTADLSHAKPGGGCPAVACRSARRRSCWPPGPTTYSS